MPANIKKMLEEHHVEFVDLRFCDLRGKEHHITIPKNKVDDNLFKHGKVFDGSSIAGWCMINKSDLVLKPDTTTAVLDPFCEISTLIIRCDVLDPATGDAYARDPRAVARRAEAHLKNSGVSDVCYFGQEVEFFIFDDVRFNIAMNGCFYEVDSNEADWNTGTLFEEGNMGHRPRIKGGYFPVPPVDSSHDLRSMMCKTLMDVGLFPEVHHHEVATSNQNEITTRYSTLLVKADEMLIFKYVLHNVAQSFGKTVTFMPKPLVGDNGGIIKHARALNAFTNPSTNSYKRLVPGFEAPVTMVYSESNRSAGIRIPHVFSEKEKRIEVRFPDALANPYLAFAGMLMAGLDGIQNKIHPGDAVDEDLYHLSAKQKQSLPSLASSLEEALDCLLEDHDFLLAGNVFNKDLITSYIQIKREEVTRLNMTTHPVEFDLYFSG